MNCAAIPSELIESELFGHMKGSFTGAVADRAGKFEQADGGTLFLDEIGDMSLAAQAKVLRVLQDGVVTRIGGIEADRRSTCACSPRRTRTLEEEIAAGRFREDLFYRLNVVPIHVPPLRERREDIPLLVAHFVRSSSRARGRRRRAMSTPEAVERLAALDWPGNVRELRNTIERLLILSCGPRITGDDVDAARRATRPADDGGPRLAARRARRSRSSSTPPSARSCSRSCGSSTGTCRETARALDMPRSNLYKKIERYGLTRGRREPMSGRQRLGHGAEKIDKQLESMSDEALLAGEAGQGRARGGEGAGRQQERDDDARRDGAFLRSRSRSALGVGMLFWPYDARCGLGSPAISPPVGVVVGGGVWSAVWTGGIARRARTCCRCCSCCGARARRDRGAAAHRLREARPTPTGGRGVPWHSRSSSRTQPATCARAVSDGALSCSVTARCACRLPAP